MRLSPAEREAEVRRIHGQLDVLDLEIAMERRAETRALNRRLERIGIKPLSLIPPPRTSERRRSVSDDDGREPVAVRAPMLVRAFRASVVEHAEGRTLDALVVPWDRAARVADAPAFEPYDEVWRRGCFAEQLSAPGRPKVLLNVEHEQGIGGVVGHAVALRDEADGLHATLRILEGADGNKALALVREGVLDGLSLEAVALSSRRTAAGVVERVKAKLRAVALCRSPAFADARVLAVRARVR